MESRFDAVARALAGGVSRREVLRRLGGAMAGAALASLGFACAEEPTGPQSGGAGHALLDARGRCKKLGQKCRSPRPPMTASHDRPRDASSRGTLRSGATARRIARSIVRCGHRRPR